MKRRFACLFLIATLCGWDPAAIASAKEADMKRLAIFCSREASSLETMAAREIRRYVYLRTGELLPIVQAGAALPGEAGGIVVARKDRPVVADLAAGSGVRAAISALDAQQYALHTLERDNRRIVLIAGGDPVGTLYGAYRFVEHLGVRFYLHGDVVPDERIALELPVLDESGKPLFELRGIQPFHDFPEGPDWWNLDDYKAIIAQLPKLRMNFIGLHTYPEAAPNAEPTVWIGLPRDAGEDGRVKSSYPSSYYNTAMDVSWGFAAKKTSEYALGASMLFDRDAYGSDVMRDMCPKPKTPDECNEVFNRAGTMLSEAFRFAHALGVKTCVGTETPLTVPKAVPERLKAMGRNPADPAVVKELYAGMFTRIAKAYPIDYYWFWTPEGWTWSGVKEEQIKATIADIQTAIAAAREVNAPFTLATCGWVLGPQTDRALLDNVLPKDMPMSCINRQVGMEPVEPGFARVSRRPKWAIPWMEDDPALTSPQLWAGRMRQDAVDALRYGCTGLMGIHWRTEILAPNVAALAQAAWDQSWNKAAEKAAQSVKTEGPAGGQVAAFPNNRIAGTQDAPLYQTVRYNLSAYHFAVPNGKYTVTLRFCEPHYAEKGKRVFGVKLQGKAVIESLDIFAKVGKDKALDYTFKDVAAKDGWIDIEFVPQVEFPSVAAIAIDGAGIRKKVNCGGPAYKDYAADWPEAVRPPRGLPTDDFYLDWATAQFGREAGPKVARVFAKIDDKLPRPSDWINGPGGIKPDPRPWEDVAKEYAFLDELEGLRPSIEGTGNRARFDYWRANFRYMKAVAHLKCVWAEFDKAMAKVKEEKDAEAKKRLARKTALPLRERLVQCVHEVYRNLLETVNTPGAMGTVTNWEQHIGPMLLGKPGEELAQALGESLLPDATLRHDYCWGTRLIVPGVRGSVAPGESLTLKVIILSAKPPREAALYWRVMGEGEFTRIPLSHVARGVYAVTLPAAPADATALEYYVKVIADAQQVLAPATDRNETLCFPVTAPSLNQTVLIAPAER
jgi:hypothetical protein